MLFAAVVETSRRVAETPRRLEKIDLLAGLLPNARITIYPDSAHGFLFQHHAEFAADVEQFLRGSDIDSSSIGGHDE